ncbi:hypothetical protein NIM87_08975 [Devosia sp. XJ19-1]|uniref:EF-hand domain-containing protein n=1 Tax=Devosia ureilytica TaxID=2952754 RepID=A0A9Q4APA6_9HYPH|nr:hypothetical protein [Devosia ureilytica]MCP8883628.1 hypothetical protein [Devosia ureilytica]MCP8887236.1 hypothetical protein [Devosia ureilytica]
MRAFLGAAIILALAPGVALGSDAGEQLPDMLYAGTATANRALFDESCAQLHMDACLGLGLIDLIGAVEGVSQAFYRHGAISPNVPAAARLLGVDAGVAAGPANPAPEPLSYEQMRSILADFVIGLDRAHDSFEMAGSAGSFVVPIDPLRVRLDIDGDGEVGAGETLAMLLGDVAALPQGKTKGNKTTVPDATIGFDTADAIWLAGYSQVAAVPVDLLLAHDFSALFAAIGHRIFPEAGLPMQDYSRGGTLMMDPETDTFIADLIAAIHTSDFPVVDTERFKGVLARLKAVTALSRRNWDAILAETDDNRELVPSPRQTSLVPDRTVTEDHVAAWMATLDTLDKILVGELLIPHWRFREGFDLALYFETATETDLVMLFAGQGALPFLRDGPVADAQSFAEGNRVFGDQWPDFALWFN